MDFNERPECALPLTRAGTGWSEGARDLHSDCDCVQSPLHDRTSRRVLYSRRVPITDALRAPTSPRKRGEVNRCAYPVGEGYAQLRRTASDSDRAAIS